MIKEKIEAIEENTNPNKSNRDEDRNEIIELDVGGTHNMKL